MQQLTSEGQQKVTELAQRYGVSTEAVLTLLYALMRGHGTMAQFDHRELGGQGQWMPGGMVMVGDMFNHALKAMVDGLCTELAALLAASPLVPAAPARSPMSSRATPHQQQGGFAFSGQPGCQPRQKLGRHRTDRPPVHKAEEHALCICA